MYQQTIAQKHKEESNKRKRSFEVVIVDEL
jgi:hypothetical protein